MITGPFPSARAAVDAANEDDNVRVFSTFSTIVAVYVPVELYELRVSRLGEWHWYPMTESGR